MSKKPKVCTLNMCIWPPYIVQRPGIDHRKAERMEMLFKYLQNEDLDILLLQEMYCVYWCQQLRERASAMGYHMVMAPAGRFMYCTEQMNTSGLCLLSKEELVEPHFVTLGYQLWSDRIFNLHRSILLATTRWTRVIIGTLHLTPPQMLRGWSSSAEQDAVIHNQMEEVWDTVQQYHLNNLKGHTGWVIGGDFNIDLDSQVFQQSQLVRKSTAHTTCPNQSMNFRVEFCDKSAIDTNDQSRYDHIITSFHIFEQLRPEVDLSDHFPTTATVGTLVPEQTSP